MVNGPQPKNGMKPTMNRSSGFSNPQNFAGSTRPFSSMAEHHPYKVKVSSSNLGRDMVRHEGSPIGGQDEEREKRYEKKKEALRL